MKKDVNNVQIAYIGGGSRGWAWGLMSDLANEGRMCGKVKLYDIDAQAAKANEVIGNKLQERDDVKSKWQYEAVQSLEEALKGADFVVISILPGTFKEMASDVHTPEKYGIYQAVGDTVGPGGIVRALRTIPMYIDIAEAIKTYAPKAWVINYTNPMTICTAVLYRVFPEIKAVGNCHEVFSTQRLLSNAYADIMACEVPAREDIKVNVFGINHFTWIDKASYEDVDLLPIYKKFVDKYKETGHFGGEKSPGLNNYFKSGQKVKFDLFDRYGIIAAAGDRHLAEFCPGKWYLKSPETVKEWGFSLTPVSWRVEHRDELLEKSEKYVSGEMVFELKETGEEGVKQMVALLGIEPLRTNCNLPNAGQIENLPLGAVVETNALFSEDSVEAISAGSLPASIHALTIPHIDHQQLVIDAVFEKDLNKAYIAFSADPLVTTDLVDSRACFDEMIENTKDWLSFI